MQVPSLSFQDPDETVTAPASSTLSASEIGEPVVELQPEVAQQPPVDIHQGPRVTVQNVELLKASVSSCIIKMLPPNLCLMNLYVHQYTQKLHQLEREISRITLDEEGCTQLNQLIEKHKLDEITQRVELASDPSRADPKQPGKNS